jgi:membrane associated rhomboid family serine protease
VAWFAHVGGFLTGILLIWVLPTSRAYERRKLRW